MSKTTQITRIKAHLDNGLPITANEAEALYGIARLASRMHDLKRMGYDFNKTMVTVYNRYGEATRVAEYRKAVANV